jgi:hypothetical protein
LASVIGVLIGAPALARAQTARPNTVPKETCAAKAPPPPDMAAWSSPTALPAALREADLGQAVVTPDHAIIADFAPVARVRYRVPPEKADGPATFGGLYRLKIAKAGTYRIASSAAPWMDVFIDKTPVTSVAHGHGPPCTGIGKMVDFPLQPGDYLLQFSESLAAKTEIMVSAAPQ